MLSYTFKTLLQQNGKLPQEGFCADTFSHGSCTLLRLTRYLAFYILILTRWAIDGIVCFCKTVVGLSSAPVAVNRIL